MAEIYKNYGTRLSTTTETVVYPGVNGTAIINGIHVANIDDSNSAAISLILAKSDTNSDQFYICKSTLVPIQSSYQALDTPIPLEANETLLAIASAENRLDVIVSVLEST